MYYNKDFVHQVVKKNYHESRPCVRINYGGEGDKAEFHPEHQA